MPANQDNQNTPLDGTTRPAASQISVVNTGSNQGVQGPVNGSVTINNYNTLVAPPDPVRALMIQQVRTIWIEGLLNHSLYREVQLLPGLRSDPGRVDLPVRMLVQETTGRAEDLPEGTHITHVYDRFGGALLILGLPGAGKTTLLLELARDLLDRALTDPALPIPVVFPLSTWATERKPLDQWLVDQLVVIYQVRRKIAQEWVATDKVLPLLDGLDEVVETQRAGCVQAINTFRGERGTLPLVVCSRLQEFDAVAQVAGSLLLHGAVIVQTLRRAAVLEALDVLGQEAAMLRDALAASERDWLWNFVTSPLGLSVLIPAVQHQPDLLLASGNNTERRDRIFNAYVDAMFTRRLVPQIWAREATISLLSWLAVQMQAHGQTLFLLENLQPSWLPKHQGSTLIFRLFAETFYAMAFPKNTITLVERLNWSWVNFWSKADIILVGTFGLGFVFAVIFSFHLGLIGGIVAGLFGGMLFGLLFGLASSLKPQPIGISLHPNQGIINSFQTALVSWLVFALILELAFGLIFGVVAGPFVGLLFGWICALAAIPAAGFQYGGTAVIQHYILRLLLAFSGLAPLNYADFLDHAVDRVLLRRVGGGWIFVHRMLLEHFAQRWVDEQATKEQRE